MHSSRLWIVLFVVHIVQLALHMCTTMIHLERLASRFQHNWSIQHPDDDTSSTSSGSSEDTITTCFIDESLTSLNWLIDLDISHLTTQNSREMAGQYIKTEVEEGGEENEEEVEEKFLFKKPAYSYPELIFMAIQDTPDKQITVAGIYRWIQDNFLYYRNKSTKSWQVSHRECCMCSVRNSILFTFCAQADMGMGHGGRSPHWKII